MIKVLSIGGFDPACVSIGHRDTLRQFYGGRIDYRVAVQRAYTPRQLQADWIAEDWMRPPGDRLLGGTAKGDGLGLLAFACEADVIQIHPGIGHGGIGEPHGGPWSQEATGFAPDSGIDMPDEPAFGIDWRPVLRRDRVRKVAYFHGSIHTWANRGKYGRHFASADYILATSTIDYAAELPAQYVPPCVCLPEGAPKARLRGDDDPFVVAHTPTDPDNCHTEAFLDLCSRLSIPVKLAISKPWPIALAAKASAFAGFDHLRGAFSVNTIENCAVGLAALVGLRREYLDRLYEDGYGVPPFAGIESLDDLERILRLHQYDSAKWTRNAQQACHRWYEQVFAPIHLAPRILDFYTRAAA